MHYLRQITLGLILLAALVEGVPSALAMLIPNRDASRWVAGAGVVVKVKVRTVTEIRKVQVELADGDELEASGDIISPIKGDVHGQLKFKFTQAAPLPLPQVQSGKMYLAFLVPDAAGYKLGDAIETDVPVVANDPFGKEPKDRLLAELMAMTKSGESAIRLNGIEQAGLLCHPRSGPGLSAVAKEQDASIVREAVIALCRSKVAPDANVVMRVFDARVMSVWYDESGEWQKDEKGKPVVQRVHGQPVFQRGLPDFDYATYVREGIKHDWVRKDDSSLYKFFGTPWKVQRKSCLPELVKLLDDPDKRVRWWAVACMTHTVENRDSPDWQKRDQEDIEPLVKHWSDWWKENGEQYMAKGSTTRP